MYLEKVKRFIILNGGSMYPVKAKPWSKDVNYKIQVKVGIQIMLPPLHLYILCNV